MQKQTPDQDAMVILAISEIGNTEYWMFSVNGPSNQYYDVYIKRVNKKTNSEYLFTILYRSNKLINKNKILEIIKIQKKRITDIINWDAKFLV